jgi:hypothetical protein
MSSNLPVDEIDVFGVLRFLGIILLQFDLLAPKVCGLDEVVHGVHLFLGIQVVSDGSFDYHCAEPQEGVQDEEVDCPDVKLEE